MRVNQDFWHVIQGSFFHSEKFSYVCIIDGSYYYHISLEFPSYFVNKVIMVDFYLTEILVGDAVAWATNSECFVQNSFHLILFCFTK